MEENKQVRTTPERERERERETETERDERERDEREGGRVALTGPVEYAVMTPPSSPYGSVALPNLP